jgi:hypothetical protein
MLESLAGSYPSSYYGNEGVPSCDYRGEVGTTNGQPMECDTVTTDPAKHLGPFGEVAVYNDPWMSRSLARCQACGNLVLRPIPQTGQQKPKTGRSGKSKKS